MSLNVNYLDENFVIVFVFNKKPAHCVEFKIYPMHRAFHFQSRAI